MAYRRLRRVSAGIAALILTLTVAGPAFAVNWHSGTLTCPAPRMTIHFYQDAWGQAPGGPSFNYYLSPAGWYYRTINANYGGGYWEVTSDGGVDYPVFAC